MARDDTIREKDTIAPTITLTSRDTGEPILDVAGVTFRLYGPPGFTTQARSSENPGEVTDNGDGTYTTKFELGSEGRYWCVVSAISAAGDRKGGEWSIIAEPLRGEL